MLNVVPVLWSVSSVESENTASGESNGSVMGIDAVSGELLTDQAWEAVP